MLPVSTGAPAGAPPASQEAQLLARSASVRPRGARTGWRRRLARAPAPAPGAPDDLRARLRATRWPDTPEDAGWSLGTDLGYLRELVAYWPDAFDWPAQEAALARPPRFRVPLRNLRIHFVDVGAAGRPGPSCRWSSATAGRTRSGVTQRSFRSSPTPADTAPTPLTPSTWSCPTFRATATPAAPPARPRRHRCGRPVGRAHGRPRLPAVRRGGRGHR